MIYSVIPAAFASFLQGAPLPYFRVMMEGRGISIRLQGSRDLVGFFTTRVVRAESEGEAIAAAKAMVELDWKTGEISSVNKESIPTLSVEWVRRDSVLGALRFNNGGHTFFPDEDEDPDSSAVV